MHRVVILALHEVVPYDLGIPALVFEAPRDRRDRALYRVRVCGEAATIRSGGFDLRVRFSLDELASADTVIVPGVTGPGRRFPERVLTALRSASMRGARVASICSGTFVLAAAGLLEGRRATTHWVGCSDLARRYPKVAVDPNVLFVDDGTIVTSAGASAGLDMCLHLVRRDLGESAAMHAARLAVAPLTREGGQAQFIHHEPPTSSASLAPLLDWMNSNLACELDVALLAKRAHVSPRTFARHFREQTGTTPVQWLLAARVRRARELLESTQLSITEIAGGVGFRSPVTFRARFQRIVGLCPTAYRRRFGAPPSGRASSVAA